jgi:hypothetical protein
MRAAIVLCLFALVACGKSAEDRRAEDAADVAAVEAAQNRMPPLNPVKPEPMLDADIARIDATGPGCMLRAGQGLVPPVLVTVGSFGWLKIDGTMLKVAGDSGSDRAPSDTWTHYTGKQVTLRIEYPGASAAATSAEDSSRPATLTLRDAWDRVVYRGEGTQSCSG